MAGTEDLVGTGAIAATAPAWPGLLGEDAEGAYINGARCRQCGHLVLSRQAICPGCWAEDAMTAEPIGRTGRLYSATVIHAAPPGFEEPYAVGYVDIEGGVRVFTHLDNGNDRPAIGDEVELTIAAIKRDAEGGALVGPLYRRRTSGKHEP